jgi:NTE family protein
MKRISEISISGGGVRGLAFLGVLYELDRSECLQLERIAGTSIGAFIAVCLIIGYTPKELIDLFFDYPFETIKDFELNHLFTQRSLMKGDNLTLFFKTILQAKINPNTTLEELYNQTNIDLYITTCCVNTGKVEYIHHDNYPTLSILTAIQMSSAIPLLLPPVVYQNKIYIDGGVMDNTPILSDQTICIASKSSKNTSKHIYKDNFHTYVFNVIKMFYEARTKSNQSMSKNHVISVHVGDVHVASFNITKDDKLMLIQSGIKAAKKYINLISPLSM